MTHPIPEARLARLLVLLALAPHAGAQIIDFEPDPSGSMPGHLYGHDEDAFFTWGEPAQLWGLEFGTDADQDGTFEYGPSIWLEESGFQDGTTEGFRRSCGVGLDPAELPFESFDLPRAGSLETPGRFFLKSPKDRSDGYSSVMIRVHGPPRHRLAGAIWDIDGIEGAGDRWRIWALDANGSPIDSVESPLGASQDCSNPFEAAPWRFVVESPPGGPPLESVRIDWIGTGGGPPRLCLDDLVLERAGTYATPPRGILAWWPMERLRPVGAPPVAQYIEDVARGHDAITSIPFLVAPQEWAGRGHGSHEFYGFEGLRVASSPDLELREGITYEAWVGDLDSSDRGGTILAHFHDRDELHGARGVAWKAFGDRVEVLVADGSEPPLVFSHTFPRGGLPEVWVHLALSLSRDPASGALTAEAFEDGASIGSVTFPAPAYLRDLGDLYIGTGQVEALSGVDPSPPFVGRLDDLAVYGRVLAPEEIAQLASSLEKRAPWTLPRPVDVRREEFAGSSSPDLWRIWDEDGLHGTGNTDLGLEVYDPPGDGAPHGFLALPGFLGDLSGLLGTGGLAFEWSSTRIEATAEAPRTITVRLEGAAGILSAEMPVWCAHENRRLHFERRFAPWAGWTYDDGTGTTRPASEGDLAAVLAQVTGLRIDAETASVDEEYTYLDDVRLLGLPQAVLEAGIAFCDCNDGAPPCPSGNDGSEGIAGCPNDPGAVGNPAGGATLRALGIPSVSEDSVVLVGANLPYGRPGLFLQGSMNRPNPTPFGDGLFCLQGPVLRLEVGLAGAAGGADAGVLRTTFPLSESPWTYPADTTYYQLWYRNQGLSPCGFGFNLTNAYQITWLP